MALFSTIVALVIYLIRLTGSVFEFFGIILYQVTWERIFKGQSSGMQKTVEDAHVIESVRLTVSGMQHDSQAGLMGRIWLVNGIQFSLQARAHMLQTIQENQHILQTKIVKPLILVGAPRTGTTLLHKLLSQDEQFFAPMTWELMSPTPPGRPKDWRNCQRFKEAKRKFAIFRHVAKDLRKVHDYSPEQPEECFVLMKQCLATYEDFVRIGCLKSRAEQHFNLPHTELVKIYQHYKKQLQCIGYQCLDDKTYLLKSHIHLRGLDALLEVLPDARLVYTHRPLSRVIPSHASMLETVTPMAVPKSDSGYGKRILRILSTYLERGVTVMKKYDQKQHNPFININYQDLVDKPLESVKQIYDYFGYKLSPETKGKMSQFLRENPQNKHGKHDYSMEKFGYTEADIRGACPQYIDYMEKLGWRAV